MTESDHLELIRAGFDAWGRELPARAQALSAFLDELRRWSRHGSLTGLRTARERVEEGILDSVPLADRISRGARLVDVGSGNGLPGLVVAVLRPRVRVVLLEPSARRAAFLRTAAAAADAANVEVVRARVEGWITEPLDAAVSRAVFPLPEWLRIAGRLVRPGGQVFALCASADRPDPPRDLVNLHSHGYKLPWSGKERCLHVFTRV